MQDIDVGNRRRAGARDQAVGVQRRRARARVRDPLRHREHVVLVHGDLQREPESLAVVPGERHRVFRCEPVVVRGPDRLRRRNGRALRAYPAELGVIGGLVAFGQEQRHRRALAPRLLEKLGEDEIVEPRPFERKRSFQGRRLDPDPGRGGGNRGHGRSRRGGNGNRARDRHGRRRRGRGRSGDARRGCARRGSTGRRRRGHGHGRAGLGEVKLEPEHDHDRKNDGDDHVAVVGGHGRALFSSGRASGTGSDPAPPQGWQRAILRAARPKPRSAP